MTDIITVMTRRAAISYKRCGFDQTFGSIPETEAEIDILKQRLCVAEARLKLLYAGLNSSAFDEKFAGYERAWNVNIIV